METAITHATEKISGNLGGYVVFHDADNDGSPDEILIMDTPDITTAVKVWRWNSGGLGYSGNGYAGPYSTLALTSDGKIVADAITTGTLNANLIKAGVISDVAGNSTIDMTNGQATLYELAAKAYSRVIDADTNDVLSQIRAGVNGGSMDLYNRNNKLAFSADVINGGAGSLRIRDALENTRVQAWVGSQYGDGLINLMDENGDATVELIGQSVLLRLLSGNHFP